MDLEGGAWEQLEDAELVDVGEVAASEVEVGVGEAFGEQDAGLGGEGLERVDDGKVAVFDDEVLHEYNVVSGLFKLRRG